MGVERTCIRCIRTYTVRYGMRHEQSNIGQSTEIRKIHTGGKYALQEDFVLEKSIFSNVFEKDIRRVFIYKKAERLAKAIHLIAPAFAGSMSLKNRIDAIAIGLIDAAIQAPNVARTALSRELLALSSLLSIARTGSILSSMNAELISREVHLLLHEVALYEEPHLSLEEAPTLSTLAKRALLQKASQDPDKMPRQRPLEGMGSARKVHIKDTRNVSDNYIKDRRETILSVIKSKRKASIKDISTLIRTVSEKTIQRELSALISAGMVLKQGERRWSTYSLTSA